MMAVARMPSNVEDNLEASSTPISADPPVKAKGDARKRMMKRLTAAGLPPERAAAVVADWERTNGPISHDIVDTWDTPQGNEALAARIAQGEQADRRMDTFQREYNEATGNVPAAPQGASQFGRRASVEEPAPKGMTVPGPRTLDGKPVTAPKPLRTDKEMEAYNTRPEGGLSKADADMGKRGMVPVVTPDGVRYMVGADTAPGVAMPGGRGRAGERPDLTDDTDLKYDVVEMVGPDGKPVRVYKPNADALAASKEKAQPYHDRVKADKAERRKQWQATAMLAGGSQNLNSGNRWIANALVGMTPEERAKAMSYMLPGAQLRVAAERGENGKDALLAKEIEAKMLHMQQQMTAQQAQYELDKQQHESELALKREQMGQQGTQASDALMAELQKGRDAHAAAMKQIEAMLKTSSDRTAADREIAQGNQGVERDRLKQQELQNEAKVKEEQRRQQLAQELGYQTQNPGLYDIIAGNPNTRAGREALKQIAGNSDKFDYLPGGGFGLNEATAMNDELLRLAKQAELLGIQSPLSDPAYRRQLIDRWGYDSGWSGGRGGWFGDWSRPMPPGL